jgi:hypothetical protein
MLEGKLSLTKQANALNLLYLYSANFQSLLACRIDLKTIFVDARITQLKLL